MRRLKKDTSRQKQIICEMIDNIGTPVYNDWMDEYMSIEDAKTYVMNY